MSKNINNFEERFKSGDYMADFSSAFKYFKCITLGKKRKLVSLKNKNSYEAFLIKKMQEILAPITELNRSLDKMTESLFRSLQSLKKDFTIVRFDFINYYNTLSSGYIYEYFIKDKINPKYHPLFEDYIKHVSTCKIGLTLSEYFSSTITNEFEKALIKNFSKLASVSTCHFTDDFFIICDKTIEKEQAISTILETLNEVYFKPHAHPNAAKIHLEDEKFYYVTNTYLPLSFNFLGLEFNLTNKGCTIGLPPHRINAIKRHFYDMVHERQNNLELLRQTLFVNTRNVIYYDNETSEAYQNYILSYYKLFFKYSESVNKTTKDFLSNLIINAFKEQSLPLPYYLKDEGLNNGYNLWYNFLNKKSITLFEDHGWSKEKLIEYISFTEKDKKKDLEKLTYKKLIDQFVNKFIVSVRRV